MKIKNKFKYIKNKAFTLLEVLIALAILSFTMVAGMLAMDKALTNTAQIEQKVLSHWVGMNIVNSLELKLLKEKLQPSKSKGDYKLKGNQYTWELEVAKTILEEVELYNIQVRVFYNKFDGNTNILQQLDSVERNVPIV